MANYVSTEKKKDEGIDFLFYTKTKSYRSGFDKYVAPPFIVRDYPFTFEMQINLLYVATRCT